MSDFQAQYDGLVRRVQGQKEVDLTALTRLQQLYQDTMGCEDPLIADRISTFTSAYDSKLSKLKEHRRQFDTLMSLTDAQVRIAHSNESINFDEDSVYAHFQDETQRARMRERILTDSEYWGTVFPLDETNPSPDITVFMPKLTELKIVTVRDELSNQSTESALDERVRVAMDYVKSHVGTLYDLLALTRKELSELESGLKQYVTADSSFRIEQMILFIDRSFPSEQWGRLTNSEKKAITYTRKRDADSNSGEFSQMTKEREERLARIILKLYDRMVEGNSQFRTDETPARYVLSWQLSDTMNTSTVFYVENFLVEKVLAQRDPLYANTVYQNLTKVLQFHRQIRHLLEPSEIASLSVAYHTRKMDNLKGWLNKRGSLTPLQQRFAENLMKEYVARVKDSPIWTQEKLSSFAAARALEHQ